MNNQIEKLYFATLLAFSYGAALLNASPLQDQGWQILHEEKFEQIEEGSLPEDFFVLDGKFQVISNNGRKCLAMSGNPVGEHGFLFGPRLNEENIELSFSCLGGLKSRRHNVFAGALGGARGLTFRVNPTSKEMILAMDRNDWQKTHPVQWSSNQWMRILIRTNWDKEKEETVAMLQVCQESSPEENLVESRILIDEKIPSGKCAIWGFAYAEKQMFWDNFLIRKKN